MRQKGQKRKKRQRDGEIPTNSFSDIAFLLIIYFLVATTLVKVKTITAEMPTGEKNAESQSDKTPTINLRAGDIHFNDKKIDIEELNIKLAELDLQAKDPSKRVILLESVDGTPYQDYFQALATISAHGGVVAIVEEDE
ncbi:MAG: biopolymer transporter ExbD [Opitutae bacterium]